MASDAKSLFRIHLGLVVAEFICVPAFVFEIYRALSGNALSWAYVVEWPLLGGYAIYMWRKMLLEERGVVKTKAATFDDSDVQLDEWNAYLASVHRHDGERPGVEET